MMAKLTIMVGFPRSGKSTWIEENKGDSIVVEIDWIRNNILGNSYHKASEPALWLVADSTTRICLGQGRDVILDGINLHSFVRAKYIELAKSMDCEVECAWVNTSMAICMNRNTKSDDAQKLSPEALYSMRDSFHPPTEGEGFSNVRIINTEGDSCQKQQQN